MTHLFQITSILLVFLYSNTTEQIKKVSPLSINSEYAPDEPDSNAYLFFDYESKIDWSKVEVTLDINTRKQLISKFDSEFSYILNSNFYKDKYDSMFHFLHLNSDTLIDVIFEGWSGGEPYVTKFFYNTGDAFELQFEAYQYISELEIKDKQLKSFKTLDFGCCAEYVDWEKSYEIAEDTLLLTLNRAKINQTTKPELYFSIPKKFTVENLSYYLRYEPIINDDEMYSLIMENIGNRVAEYTKGDTGFAFAEMMDSTGRIWWYVEMETNENIKNSVIYDTEISKSRYLGWMSSRFLIETE